jgi:hypothetical protein
MAFFQPNIELQALIINNTISFDESIRIDEHSIIIAGNQIDLQEESAFSQQQISHGVVYANDFLADFIVC